MAELFEGARGEVQEIEKRGDGCAEQPGLRRREVTAGEGGEGMIHKGWSRGGIDWGRGQSS